MSSGRDVGESIEWPTSFLAWQPLYGHIAFLIAERNASQLRDCALGLTRV